MAELVFNQRRIKAINVWKRIKMLKIKVFFGKLKVVHWTEAQTCWWSANRCSGLINLNPARPQQPENSLRGKHNPRAHILASSTLTKFVITTHILVNVPFVLMCVHLIHYNSLLLTRQNQLTGYLCWHADKAVHQQKNKWETVGYSWCLEYA